MGLANAPCHSGSKATLRAVLSPASVSASPCASPAPTAFAGSLSTTSAPEPASLSAAWRNDVGAAQGESCEDVSWCDGMTPRGGERTRPCDSSRARVKAAGMQATGGGWERSRQCGCESRRRRPHRGAADPGPGHATESATTPCRCPSAAPEIARVAAAPRSRGCRPALPPALSDSKSANCARVREERGERATAGWDYGACLSEGDLVGRKDRLLLQRSDPSLRTAARGLSEAGDARPSAGWGCAAGRGRAPSPCSPSYYCCSGRKKKGTTTPGAPTAWSPSPR